MVITHLHASFRGRASRTLPNGGCEDLGHHWTSFNSPHMAKGKQDGAKMLCNQNGSLSPDRGAGISAGVNLFDRRRLWAELPDTRRGLR